MDSYVFILIASFLVLLTAIFLFSYFSSSKNVSFSVFKSNLYSSSKVAIFATYSNNTQFVYEDPCFDSIIEVIAHSKPLGSISFFLSNSTTCYFPSSLGPNSSLRVDTFSHCLSIAKSETSIFLNYSSFNYTIVTPYHLYIGGNENYMKECPIATDLFHS
ncbi:MAG: hypothetical protein QXL16_02095 [Candidatus Micrarchaeaceae archaeon]